MLTIRKRKIIKSLDPTISTFPSTKEMAKFFECIVKFCSENMSYVVYLPEDFKNIDLNFDR